LSRVLLGKRGGPLKPRFLMPGGGQGPERLGYSHEPLRRLNSDTPETKDRIAAATDLRDEPESLDLEDYKRFIDPEKVMRERQRIRLEVAELERARRLLSFEERLTIAQVEARSRRIDVTSEVRLLKHMQQSGKEVRHLEQRLGVVERKVWRNAV
jgi:hypothetical protein